MTVYTTPPFPSYGVRLPLVFPDPPGNLSCRSISGKVPSHLISLSNVTLFLCFRVVVVNWRMFRRPRVLLSTECYGVVRSRNPDRIRYNLRDVKVPDEPEYSHCFNFIKSRILWKEGKVKGNDFHSYWKLEVLVQFKGNEGWVPVYNIVTVYK